MFFKAFFDENLAQMSYMVACQQTGEAIVIDPARDVNPYYETANKEGLTITKATETHIHADFLSGARELAKRGEVILYLSSEGGEDWNYQYLDAVKHALIGDQDHFYVGGIRLDVIHTPGHTPESLSFVLTDEGGGSTVPMGVFTGDFVFVGDVGRPDLLEKSAGEKGTSESGAKQMFQSLKRFKELPDYLQVWPGHGAGSACGKALGAVPSSTIGYEKKNNWALKSDREDHFTSELLEGQPEPPKYFTMMKQLNKSGPNLLGNQTVESMTIDQIEYGMDGEYVLIDTRHPHDFAKGHIEGALNIPFNRSFANWAGWIVDYNQSIILIARKGEVEPIRKALESIGLDQVIAFIDIQQVENMKQVETYRSITVDQLEENFRGNDRYILVDVRNPVEWDEGHIEGAMHLMLGKIKDEIDEIPADKTPIVHCRSGMRSAIAASILQANGFKDVINLTGGFLAWAEKNEPVTS